MSVITVEGLGKRYAGAAAPAVHDVSFTVADREFMVLLGPSGCGKSTVLRMIAGLEPITSGTVSIDGKVVNAVPAKLRDIAMVFQSYALYPHMTVYENLAFGLRRRSIEQAEVARRVNAAAAKLGLTEFLKRKPYALSGGQRQRVAIAQQLLCSEHFLLMDEPFSGLDVVMEAKVCELINEIACLDELNTIIVVTHDVTAAATVADHLWLMGRDRDASGNNIPGARIQETYDLIERDMCWHPEITNSPKFLEFVREVKERFQTL